MAQLKKVTQKFQDKAYVGKVNTTGLARLLHVNEVIDWVRGAADLEFVSNVFNLFKLKVNFFRGIEFHPSLTKSGSANLEGLYETVSLYS